MTKTTLFTKYQSGGQFNVIDQALTTGQVFWVSSTSAQAVDGAGAGFNPDYPFATIDFAIGQCVANGMDTIFVMPRHAETLAAAGSITCDVTGIKIVGLGTGLGRPIISSSAAAGSVLITCPVWLENLVFSSGFDATVNLINVGCADVVIKDCLFRDVTGQATDMIVTLNDADHLVIDGCTFRQAVAAGPNSAIGLVGADWAIIRNCNFAGNYAVGAIDFRGTASLQVTIRDCKFWTNNAADIAIIDTITGSTGFIGPNLQIMLTDNAANITEAITGATFRYFDNIYVCNLAGEKAMLINKIASA